MARVAGGKAVDPSMQISVGPGIPSRCERSRPVAADGSDPEAEATNDLIQRLFGPCTELDRSYVGDITYVMTWEG